MSCHTCLSLQRSVIAEYYCEFASKKVTYHRWYKSDLSRQFFEFNSALLRVRILSLLRVYLAFVERDEYTGSLPENCGSIIKYKRKHNNIYIYIHIYIYIYIYTCVYVYIL